MKAVFRGLLYKNVIRNTIRVSDWRKNQIKNQQIKKRRNITNNRNKWNKGGWNTIGLRGLNTGGLRRLKSLKTGGLRDLKTGGLRDLKNLKTGALWGLKTGGKTRGLRSLKIGGLRGLKTGGLRGLNTEDLNTGWNNTSLLTYLSILWGIDKVQFSEVNQDAVSLYSISSSGKLNIGERNSHFDTNKFWIRFW